MSDMSGTRLEGDVCLVYAMCLTYVMRLTYGHRRAYVGHSEGVWLIRSGSRIHAVRSSVWEEFLSFFFGFVSGEMVYRTCWRNLIVNRYFAA